MKVFAVADIHAKKNKLHHIQHVVQQNKPDVLIVAGDIVNYIHPAPVMEQLSQLALPVFYIRGNSDPAKLDKIASTYPNLTSLHANPTRLEGISAIGISGTVPLPFHSKIKLKESKILAKIAPLVTKESCLVCHPPPRGAGDRVFGRFHVGSKGLALLVKRRQPRLVLCGHVHEDPAITSIGNTPIVNCSIGKTGRGALVEFDQNGTISTIALL